MTSQSQGIQQLLQAEKRAKDKLEEAKKRKGKRLRQAKEEAMAEIDHYRLQREKEFRNKQTNLTFFDHIQDCIFGELKLPKLWCFSLWFRVKVVWMAFSYLNDGTFYTFIHLSCSFLKYFRECSQTLLFLLGDLPLTFLFLFFFSPACFVQRQGNYMCKSSLKKSQRGQIKTALQTCHFSHTSHKTFSSRDHKP
ncbi:V-type proton ATPase subunit G 3 isoform X1 [Cuculus canorus]|uniref:V-type proton ATPase subunit G 3 isoform X1 n=1 Tax=Cuculus canorus TaxID=55661 RepID=UPI0023AA4915|nr:V-type proton ATPase subunit G 3 isoform X1 [Cuculus canorus]